MKRILILGAYGEIARVATRLFLEKTDVHLSLYLRHAARLKSFADHPRVTLIEGDVLDARTLAQAMSGQDVVYANLSGHMAAQAKNIIAAMQSNRIKRLIFVSSMGIYDEVPGQTYRSILDPYRDSAHLIEASQLDYTIIRPAWLNNNDDISYETTCKGETFKYPERTVSRKSVADLILKLATTNGMSIRESLGVNKIKTD